ncbi:helix-turn-helix transcriptional regulator [Pseudonocardia aurantiaca]|uniref:XRE family transcriptional regulator n=1 Tax=Pseudonocardia aurantiaca TaxID=75290 RepID=A0ABW4FS05_9PSEU
MEDDAGDSFAARRTENRARQRELYGAPLGDRVRRLTSALGISQARLARTLGVSPAMLSQLVSARRVKIGDPAVLARMLLLDQRCQSLQERPDPRTVETLLADVAVARWQWNDPRTEGEARVPERRFRERGGPAHGSAAAALRGVTDPARLAAAAAALGPGFPELAEVLRQAASRPRA